MLNIKQTFNFIKGGWWMRSNGMKAMPLAWPSFMDGSANWQMVDVESYIREGYNLNTLIYSAINYKGHAISSVPFRAYEGNPDNPVSLVPAHPLSQLMARPNEFQSMRMLMMSAVTSLNLSGNTFIAMDREMPGMLPRSLMVLNPTRVRIIPGDRGILGYKYVPVGMGESDGVPILKTDMMHIKLPNPLDKYEGQGFGMSPVAPMSQSADADNKVTRFLYTFFKRGTLIGGALKFANPITDEQAGRYKARWREMYGGVDKWATEVAILDNGGEYQRMTPTFDEMGFGPIDERNETRILGPFGVAPILIGSRIGLYRSTYSNYEQARRATWEDTLTWEIGLFDEEFKYHLSSDDDDTFVQTDTSRVPALQKDVPKLILAAKDMQSMGVPARVAFNTVGLRVEDYPGIDTVYLPPGMIPVGIDKPDNPYLLDEPSESDPADGTVNAGAVEGDGADSAAKKKAV